MKKTKVFFISLFLIILVGCNNTLSKNIKVKENENGFEKDAV